MKKIGQVVEVIPEYIEKYKMLHAEVWPGVLEVIKKSKIQNYSIFLKELPGHGVYLFSYFEYTGSDYAFDMAQIGAAPITQKWWAECKPCLRPLKGVSIDQCWAGMEQVFFLD
jgi:L-rhamnose mutarotase